MSDLLPPNATAQERALSDSIERIGAVPAAVRDVWSPDACPASMLPWLAWAFSVDTWEQGWSQDQKRAVIKQSISVHRKKGTIGAVVEAINALGIGAQVIEWHKQIPAGDPYTFSLSLDAQQDPITLNHLIQLVDVVNSAKNLRSHLSTVRPGATSRTDVYTAIVAMVGSEITVKPASIPLAAEDDEVMLAEDGEELGTE